ncbi:MAG: PilC/PilY family type IV pilus protein [Rudaea sp.]|nr:PilC/PilY family type IV pilus protein [Rudaea sp.]
MTHLHRQSVSVLRATLAAFALAASLGASAAAVAPNDPTDLSPTPPDLTSAVNPNIFVTFDDSGSMAWTRMGDTAPYLPTCVSGTGSSSAPCFSASNDTNTSGFDWKDGPWRCANVVDPDHPTATDVAVRRLAMNGVYYNPKIVYSPPLKEDGTLFPNADATLQALWIDGIAVNRPYNAVTAATTAGYNGNMDLNGGSNDTGTTNAMGPNAFTYSTGSSATCGSYPSSVCSCSGSGSSKTCKVSDIRWTCGTGATTSANWTGASPMNNTTVTLSDGTSSVYPNGGPYYYRLKTTVTINLNAYGLPATNADLVKLYTAGNWEAVPVPTSQYQNFANWYAYYRARNLMARSSLARVFGVLGTPQKANIRVTWQNLGNNNNLNWTATTSTGAYAGTQIVELDDTTSAPSTAPYSAGQSGNSGWRQAFFNWIYNVQANNGTPSRNALLRAGNYFKTGNGVTTIKNPYWQPANGATAGRELACRQNFHILMTDGLYNQPAVSSPGSPTSSSWTLPTNPSGITSYSPTATVSQLYAHGGASNWTTDGDGGNSYSDIAFNFWATNLRPDFSTTGGPNYTPDTVPPYFADLTTGVTATTSTVNPNNPGATPEVFWNPLNDPATWPHLVQFAVSLGAFGNLTYSSNTDCQNGVTAANDDGCALRTAAVNSSGSVGWPKPNGTGSGIPANIDDLWHAALNGRGSFFVATSPQVLVSKLTKILTNVISRSGSSAAESVSSSILNAGSFAYQGGYNSSGWPGFLYKQPITQDPVTGVVTIGTPVWDAGCFLTGGTCAATGGTVTAVNPAARIIFTSVGSPGSLAAQPFEWTNLGANEQMALNLDPTTTYPNTTTGLVINSGTPNGTVDPNGTYRLSYLRGTRKYESASTPTTAPVTFRPRLSVLGAIVDSAAVYEGGPSSGWQDIYPVGSPEQTAAVAGNTYELFVHNNLNREAMIYVGANDGMLHAFDAVAGTESWAYVPNLLYGNGQLDQVTNANNGVVPTVDDSPIIQDVFINGHWRTILIGSLRLGGRGIYALDVTCTSPGSATSCTPSSETTAASQFLWEFSSQQDADLGYTYASTNIARIRCNVSPCKGTGTPGGTWVVLVTSGYSPVCLPAAQGSSTCAANGQSVSNTAPGATTKASGPTYLWVLNASDGSLIAKIPTTSGVTSYGLSTPSVVDFGLDQIDDVAVAGDLTGNVWRFDLTDPNPSNWAGNVDALFKTYTSTAACSTSNTAGIGCEPISVMPVAFPDTVNGGVVYVFGSGQYLGASDNNTSSVYATQHFFGVRDYGTHFSATDGGSSYPFHESDLNSRTLTQDALGNRSLPYTASTTVAHPRGWEIPLNVTPTGGSTIVGERDVVTASPLFSAGIAILTSLIPGQNADPCQPGRSGAVISVNAASGGPPLPSPTGASTSQVGSTVTNPPAVGGISAISLLGGSGIILPGMGGAGGAGNTVQLQGLTPIWRRTSWNELLNQL